MYLFPNFLEDPKEYVKAEKLWREKWKDLTKRVMQGDSWVAPWGEMKFADGTPERDGNPIFSAIDRSRHLAVRVIQMQRSAGPELTFWIDTFAPGQKEAADELVVACVLSDETLLQAVDLMAQWATEGGVSLIRDREGHRIIFPRIGRSQTSRRYDKAA